MENEMMQFGDRGFGSSLDVDGISGNGYGNGYGNGHGSSWGSGPDHYRPYGGGRGYCYGIASSGECRYDDGCGVGTGLGPGKGTAEGEGW